MKRLRIKLPGKPFMGVLFTLILLMTMPFVIFSTSLLKSWDNTGQKEKKPVDLVKLSVQTLNPSYARSEPIKVKFSGLPGNSQDVITVAQASAAPNAFGQFYYSGGKRSGELTFRGFTEPGDYEVRVYFNYPDGGYEIQARYPFKVRPYVLSGTAGESVPPSFDLDAIGVGGVSWKSASQSAVQKWNPIMWPADVREVEKADFPTRHLFSELGVQYFRSEEKYYPPGSKLILVRKESLDSGSAGTLEAAIFLNDQFSSYYKTYKGQKYSRQMVQEKIEKLTLQYGPPKTSERSFECYVLFDPVVVSTQLAAGKSLCWTWVTQGVVIRLFREECGNIREAYLVYSNPAADEIMRIYLKTSSPF